MMIETDAGLAGYGPGGPGSGQGRPHAGGRAPRGGVEAPRRPDYLAGAEGAGRLAGLAAGVQMQRTGARPYLRSGCHLRTGLCHRRQVLPGALLDHVETAFLDGFGVDQFAPYRDRAGARLQERGGGLQVYASGRNHLDLRKRALEGLDVLGPADVAAGKDLHHIGAGFPGGQDFGGVSAPGQITFE